MKTRSFTLAGDASATKESEFSKSKGVEVSEDCGLDVTTKSISFNTIASQVRSTID
jgi:hypothetical protein